MRRKLTKEQREADAKGDALLQKLSEKFSRELKAILERAVQAGRSREEIEAEVFEFVGAWMEGIDVATAAFVKSKGWDWKPGPSTWEAHLRGLFDRFELPQNGKESDRE